MKVVPITRISAKSKHWWTKELTTLRRQADKLEQKASKLSHLPYHHLHTEHTAVVKLYHTTLKYTKKQHWRDWLEKAEDSDIWTVNRLINSQALDGGKSRIPILTHKTGSIKTKATMNDKKSKVLAKTFFPIKPPAPSQEEIVEHNPCCTAERISSEHIMRQLCKIKPYNKAPGPDGIPNIVLTKCADLLLNRRFQIYSAIYERKLLYELWKHFISCTAQTRQATI